MREILESKRDFVTNEAYVLSQDLIFESMLLTFNGVETLFLLGIGGDTLRKPYTLIGFPAPIPIQK